MTMTHPRGFKSGFRASLSVSLAMFFLFISVGALCAENLLSFGQSLLMTALISAAPLQIIILQHAGSSADLWMIFLFSILVNFRFFLMSAAMFPYCRQHRLFPLVLGFAGLSASSFALSFPEFQKDPHMHHFPYYLATMLSCYSIALIGTVIGFELTTLLRSPYLTDILSMILPINFTLLTAKYWPKLKPIVITLSGFLLFPVLEPLTGRFTLLILPLVISSLILMCETIKRHRT